LNYYGQHGTYCDSGDYDQRQDHYDVKAIVPGQVRQPVGAAAHPAAELLVLHFGPALDDRQNCKDGSAQD